MKVGTLTFPNSPSHGAALQMYALWKVLSDLGCDAEVINYSTDIVIHNKKNNIRPSAKSRVKKLVNEILGIKSSKPAFKRFEQNIVKYPQNPIDKTDKINIIDNRYDRIFVGSDQVWNPIVTGNDMNFYLKFVNDPSVKASYAPSFGNDDVANEDKEEISKYLADLTYLCAREKQGAKIIKDLTGREVPVVLDPTFLLNKNQWQPLEKKPKYKKDYVLFYNIKPSPKLKAFAKRLADAQNCILVTIGGTKKEILNPKKHPEFGVGPSEFLGLISNAKYVVTNSFHGTAFSIIYRKNFYVEYSSDTNSRLTNIIDMLGLDMCVANENTDVFNAVNVDYKKAEVILNEKIDYSMDYLKSVIKG